jgi:hypothetical protein
MVGIAQGSGPLEGLRLGLTVDDIEADQPLLGLDVGPIRDLVGGAAASDRPGPAGVGEASDGVQLLARRALGLQGAVLLEGQPLVERHQRFTGWRAPIDQQSVGQRTLLTVRVTRGLFAARGLGLRTGKEPTNASPRAIQAPSALSVSSPAEPT